MIEPHPLTAAIAQDLAAHLPRWASPTMHELHGVASLAAALVVSGDEIRANGCNDAQARTYAQILGRLRDGLAELGCETAGTRAALILTHAAALSSATLALMPPAGNA